MITNPSKAYHVTIGIGQVIILTSLGFYFHLHRRTFVSADNSAYAPLETIFLDCGSAAEQSLSYDSRNWSTDIGSDLTASNSDSNSTVSNALKGAAVPGVPYMTARLFYSKFSYTFNVTPGPKFIRLYFYSDSYGGLNASESFLTVISGHYTLLRNFSCYLNAEYLNVDYFFKEFIIHVENHTLELTFSPTSNAPNAYAFVNGIEVVSMPLHLYLRGDNVPLPFVGFLPNVLMFGNDYALETVYRANVGGQIISPHQDTGMFRTWDADESYIFGAAYGQIDNDNTLSIQYPKTVQAYTAPGDVYRTARSMGQYNEINKNYNLSWFFPADTGFKYLIRLHFCEIVPVMTLENERVFFIFINNQTAETQADVINWSKGHGIPVYRDYVVMIPPQAVGKQDLWLELHPNIEVKPVYYDAILNGVEIFKISNSDGNLGGLNPPLDESDVQPSPVPSKKSKKGLQKQIKYSLGGPVVFVLSLCAFLLIKIKRKANMKETKDPSHCRSFPINEIRKATNNFDESKIIGKGDFGKVYKGCIIGIDTAVAIKRRSKATSEQGFREEVKMLSQIRHHNVISLLGYCQEDLEMILVYEYADNGSLSDHLHFVGQRTKPLTWNQRLEICVGVARGLHYLHTGEKRPIIHCNLNTFNILLDKNWRAKISSFGSTTTSYGSDGSDVEGSFGSLGLDYHWDKKVMEKTDVYLFGLVLLEVLSGRPVPIDLRAENDENDENGDSDDDHESLIPSSSYCLEKGDGDQLVDQHLEGKIPSDSLQNFVKITKQCLAKKGVKRPSISDVLYNLEQLQVRGDSDSDASPKGLLYPESSSDLMLGVEFSEIMMSSGR